jgi:hypothetical protein
VPRGSPQALTVERAWEAKLHQEAQQPARRVGAGNADESLHRPVARLLCQAAELEPGQASLEFRSDAFPFADFEPR